MSADTIMRSSRNQCAGEKVWVEEGICEVSEINKACEMGGEGKMKVSIEWF